MESHDEDDYENESEEEEQEDETSREEIKEPEDEEEVLIEPEGYQEPTVHEAEVVPGEAFKVEEFVHDGEGDGLRRHMITSFKSWKNMVGVSFTITCRDKSWKVYKRRNEFYNLDKHLRGDLAKDGESIDIEIPEYKDHDDETQESMDESLRGLSDWLQRLAHHPKCWHNQVLLEFCEVSSCTYKYKGVIRFKEGLLEKRSGGRFKQENQTFQKITGKCCRKWEKRWCVLTDKYLAILTDSSDENADEILLFDNDFHVLYGKDKTGETLGIHVVNKHRKLHMKAHDAFEWTTWLRAFKTAIENNGLQARVMREHESFAPERANNHVKIYADGEDYYNDLYDQLNTAKSQIFITDWWLTPELYLRRPVDLKSGDMEKYRLDNILMSLAERGVKIYILVWKEVEIAGLYNLSSHVKEVLQGKHKNIVVFRHPTALISFWSHHEKICVIDQKKGFVGGIDLCMGRYDTNAHPIKDTGDKKGRHIFPGKDYSNSRIKDFLEVADYKTELIDRNTTPRMPWHDIHLFLEGESAQDLAFHFIEYWNHAKYDIEGWKDKNDFGNEGKEGVFLRPISTITHSVGKRRGRNFDGQVEELSSFSKNEEFGIIGKEYIDYLVFEDDEEIELDTGANKFDQHQILKELEKADQEHKSGEDDVYHIRDNRHQENDRDNDADSGAMFDVNYDGSTGVLDRMQQFIDEEQQKRQESHKSQWLTKITGGTTEDEEKRKYMAEFVKKLDKKERKQLKKEYRLARKGEVKKTKEEEDMSFGIAKSLLKKKHGTCRCQVLRSSCLWSTGIRIPEHSILNAYIDLISNAQKFIYIENQFFMSNAGGKSIIENKITQALKNRIIKAHQNGEKLRVYVFIPLMPGFEGDIAAQGGEVLMLQIKFQQQTISKGASSLFAFLKRENIDPSQYVRFYGLRQHDMFDDAPKSEMIYIHSKCLIVDDRAVIIGSANINDRSMLGTRDSEVCLLIKDEAHEDSVMGGEDFKVGKVPHEFRMRLMAEHFGTEDFEDVRDPCSDEFFDAFFKRARTNAQCFYEAFKCEPDNHQTTFEQLKEDREAYKNMSNEQKHEVYRKIIKKVKGHVVEWPLSYMENQELDLDRTDVEYYVPKINFT